MEISGLSVRKHTSISMAVVAAVSLMLGAAIPPKHAYSQDVFITVSCYKGNNEEGNYIGELTVNNRVDAAQQCNVVYEDCKGQCLGCIIDSNFNQACYDKDGKNIAQIRPGLKGRPSPKTAP